MTKEYQPGERRLKWVVEFTIDAVWVQDGFNLTDERALDMLAHDLRYANVGLELDAKVIKAPADDTILRIQGYKPETMSAETKRDLLK